MEPPFPLTRPISLFRRGRREQKVTPRALSCRYKVLMRSLALPEDIRGKCTVLLQLYDATNSEWQLGKTKVEWRESATTARGSGDIHRCSVPRRCSVFAINIWMWGGWVCVHTHTHIPGSQEC